MHKYSKYAPRSLKFGNDGTNVAPHRKRIYLHGNGRKKDEGSTVLMHNYA